MPQKGLEVEIPNTSLANLFWSKCKNRRNNDTLPAVIDYRNGKSITFLELHDMSRKCAAFLHHRGVKKGDVIGVVSSSSFDQFILMIGIIGCGATITSCLPTFTEGEILRTFTTSQPTRMFVNDSWIAYMKRVQQQYLPGIKEFFVLGTSNEYITLNDILETNYDQNFLNELEIDPATQPAVIIYTSGTTGYPKAIVKTHRNLVASYVLSEEMKITDENSCLYTGVPVSLSSGYSVALKSIMMGSKIVIGGPFTAKSTLRVITNYRVTHIDIATPYELMELVKAAGCEEYDTSSLKTVYASGSAAASSVTSAFANAFGVQVYTGYGTNETSFTAVRTDIEGDPISVGKPMPTVEIKIVDLSTHEECAANVDGEIYVRGPQVMKGYLRREGTGEIQYWGVDTQGWFATEDLGHFDKLGNLYIVDRLKDMIKFRAWTVSPGEVEGILLAHPKVADVGVVGIPHPIDGEHARAYIVKNTDNLSEDEIQEYVREQLSDKKQLTGGVKFVVAIPRSAVGKVLRRELRKL